MLQKPKRGLKFKKLLDIAYEHEAIKTGYPWLIMIVLFFPVKQLFHFLQFALEHLTFFIVHYTTQISEFYNLNYS